MSTEKDSPKEPPVDGGPLGKALTQAVENAHVSLTAIARAADISRQTLYRIMSGESLPQMYVLQRIATTLGVMPGALLDGAVVPDPNAPPLPDLSVASLESDVRSVRARLAHYVTKEAMEQRLEADYVSKAEHERLEKDVVRLGELVADLARVDARPQSEAPPARSSAPRKRSK